MRILVLIHEYPPIGGGGGRVAYDVCQGLARRGHEVQVLTTAFKGLARDEVQEGVRVRRLASGRAQAYKAGLPDMAVYVFQSVWTGLSLVHSWRPDLIHVHFAVPAGAAAWMLSLLTGVPYMLTVHLGDTPGGVPEKTNGWFRWIQPFTPPIWRRARKVTAVSEFTRNIAAKHYPVPIQVILNGVDRSFLDPGKIKAGSPPQLVFAGRFQPQKNPVEVVRILAELKEYAWDCQMLGDGPLRSAVEAEIASAGLQDRIHLHGWVTPEQVIEQFRHSDILLMPSLSEGLPVVGVQALALGLAIVVSKVGGCVELIESGRNGFLIAPDDHNGFITALRNLLCDPCQLESFRLASQQISRRFDLESILSQYEAVFKEAVG